MAPAIQSWVSSTRYLCYVFYSLTSSLVNSKAIVVLMQLEKIVYCEGLITIYRGI